MKSGDLIDRQVAIDAVQGIGRLATLPDNDAVVRMSAVEYVLFNLPSAQPDVPDTNVGTNGDTIYRQDAIDAVDKLSDEPIGYLEAAIDALVDLPSAQPEPHYDEWCTDCKEYNQERHCCPRWNKVIKQTVEDLKGADMMGKGGK